MLEKLAELIKEQLNYDGEVKAESNFKDDLGADSLDLFELVMSMEEEFGVEIIRKQIDGVSEDAQLEALEELSQEQIDGLAIMPVQSERIREKLNDMTEQNDLPIITFNSDIVGTNRVCYVGLDNKRSGMTAAGLMGMLTRGTGKVLVITGFFTNSVNNLRVDGFIQELKMSYPEIELLGVQSSFDEMSEVEKIVENTIEIAPDLAGIFVVSGGQAGVCKAMQNLNMETRPYVIGYDVTPTNIKALKEGTYDFLIDQEGFEQGYRPPHMLYNMIRKGEKIEKEYAYTDISIKTKYNL